MPEATDSPTAISIKDLRVDYGDNVAVDGISLEIPEGEIFGLVGPNGAGKTSTFKVMATLMDPTYGKVSLCGHDIADRTEKARGLLGYMPDLAPVPSDLKVWEFLDLFGACHGIKRGPREKKIADALAHVQLVERRDDFCHNLSRGMKQRLALAKTMLHDPKVMILDEPASGMDPVSRAALRTTLQELANRGTTVIVSSHILSELSAMCTSVGIMSKGHLVASGSIEEVLNQFSGQKALTIQLVRPAPSAEEVIRNNADCHDIQVEAEGSRLICRFSGDNESQSRLLASLVQAGCPVQTFSEKSQDIESIILDLDAHTSGNGDIQFAPENV